MKILVLLSRFPYPLEKGDKLRAFHHIKELSKKHKIVLCALSDTKIEPAAISILQQYCEHIEIIKLPKWKIYWNIFRQLLLSNQSLQVAYFYNKKAQQKVDALIKSQQPNHIYCQLIRVAEYVRHSSIPKTLDYMDALARGMERRVEDAPFYLQWFFKIETTRLLRYEHFIFEQFDHHIIISEQDRKLIVNINNDKIKVVANGVDYDTYKYKEAAKKYDLIFTGNMAYPPNVDSVVYLISEVMPLVWEEYPKLTVVIAGAHPSPKVLKLKSERVIVTGWVEDISAYYAQSKVFIAPMQIGTGLQNKLLEAMAMKIPCITSELANNALGATPNKNILVGNTPSSYQKHIVSLMKNKELQKEIGTQGYNFVKENYTWEETTAILEKVLEEKVRYYEK